MTTWATCWRSCYHSEQKSADERIASKGSAAALNNLGISHRMQMVRSTPNIKQFRLQFRDLESILVGSDILRVGLRHTVPRGAAEICPVVVMGLDFLRGNHWWLLPKTLRHELNAFGECLVAKHLVHTIRERHLGNEMITEIFLVVPFCRNAVGGVLDKLVESKHWPFYFQGLSPEIAAEQSGPRVPDKSKAVIAAPLCLAKVSAQHGCRKMLRSRTPLRVRIAELTNVQ